MERFIVMHDIDMADFMKTLDQCKGDVFLETKEGDVLNLKSKLCQMLGLSKPPCAALTLRTRACCSGSTFIRKFPARKRTRTTRTNDPTGDRAKSR